VLFPERRDLNVTSRQGSAGRGLGTSHDRPSLQGFDVGPDRRGRTIEKDREKLRLRTIDFCSRVEDFRNRGPPSIDILPFYNATLLQTNFGLLVDNPLTLKHLEPYYNGHK
jgi:hypothetical protein